MKTLLTIIFVYLLINQFKNMWSLLFKWQLVYAQVNDRTEKPDILKDTSADIDSQIIAIVPHLMIYVYIVTICFHTYFGLKYCSMYMLPFAGLFVFFVTLEYLSELPIFFHGSYLFPNLLTNRLFCFLETASKIAYYVAGMLFMFKII